MGKTISLVMQKGGSGKTTICDQLAFSLKEQGKTVEVLDLDDQQGSRFKNEGIENPEYTIIDTRGALDMPIDLNGQALSIEDVIESSDLVLIPFLPEADSEAPLANVVNRCNKVGTDYRIIFNKLDLSKHLRRLSWKSIENGTSSGHGCFAGSVAFQIYQRNRHQQQTGKRFRGVGERSSGGRG